jgi:small conductance mechanosensitive channel
MPKKKKENTLIQILPLAQKCTITTQLMVLKRFSVEIGPILAAAGTWHLVLGQYLIRDIISSFIILENQYRIGDVVKFDEQEVPLKRSV